MLSLAREGALPFPSIFLLALRVLLDYRVDLARANKHKQRWRSVLSHYAEEEEKQEQEQSWQRQIRELLEEREQLETEQEELFRAISCSDHQKLGALLGQGQMSYRPHHTELLQREEETMRKELEQKRVEKLAAQQDVIFLSLTFAGLSVSQSLLSIRGLLSLVSVYLFLSLSGSSLSSPLLSLSFILLSLGLSLGLSFSPLSHAFALQSVEAQKKLGKERVQLTKSIDELEVCQHQQTAAKQELFKYSDDALKVTSPPLSLPDHFCAFSAFLARSLSSLLSLSCSSFLIACLSSGVQRHADLAMRLQGDLRRDLLIVLKQKSPPPLVVHALNAVSFLLDPTESLAAQSQADDGGGEGGGRAQRQSLVWLATTRRLSERDFVGKLIRFNVQTFPPAVLSNLRRLFFHQQPFRELSTITSLDLLLQHLENWETELPWLRQLFLHQQSEGGGGERGQEQLRKAEPVTEEVSLRTKEGGGESDRGKQIVITLAFWVLCVALEGSMLTTRQQLEKKLKELDEMHEKLEAKVKEDQHEVAMRLPECRLQESSSQQLQAEYQKLLWEATRAGRKVWVSRLLAFATPSGAVSTVSPV